jgi:hypothetical protein
MASDAVHTLAARVEAAVGEGFDPKVSVRRGQPSMRIWGSGQSRLHTPSLGIGLNRTPEIKILAPGLNFVVF